MALHPARIALLSALGALLAASARAQDPGAPSPAAPQPPASAPAPSPAQAEPAPSPTYVEPVPSPTYAEPLPAPPRHRDIAWSIRFNPIDLVWGKTNLEIEHAFLGPFSVVVAPQYMFADPRQSSTYNVKGKGFGVYGELGYWIDGLALRGYFVKAHFEYSSIKFTSDTDSLTVPQTLIGAMFGSQSIHSGWFTLEWGLGVAYDLSSQERTMGIDPLKNPVLANEYVIPATGPLNNGFDFLTQLAIGGSF